jgi:hypothetical protein
MQLALLLFMTSTSNEADPVLCVVLLLVFGFLIIAGNLMKAARERERQRERAETIESLPEHVQDVVTTLVESGKREGHARQATTYEGKGLRVTVEDQQIVTVEKTYD